MNSSILKQLHQRPIAYYPIYRQITGSTTAGILLSQLMYWFSKKDKFYKTDKEIMEETLLTKRELEGAKQKIKKLSFIKVTREGIPAKTFYQINWEKYEEELQGNSDTQNEESILHKTCNSDSTNCGNSDTQNEESNTKTTTKTSNTKTTTNNKKEKKYTKKEKNLFNEKTFKLLEELGVDEEFIEELLKYRKMIGKPVKTPFGLNRLLFEYIRIKNTLNLSPKEIFEIQAENEWQGIKLEWIMKIKKEEDNNKKIDLSKFGFDTQNETIDIKLIGGL